MYCRLVTGSADGTARVWNVTTGECERVLSGHTGGAVHTVDFDPVSSHRRIVSGGNDRSARVWQGNAQQLLLGHIRGGMSFYSEFD
jgi:WD40 repeat protein